MCGLASKRSRGIDFESAGRPSARVVAHGERNRQADEEPMLDEFGDLVEERSVSFGKSRQRQHEVMHE